MEMSQVILTIVLVMIPGSLVVVAVHMTLKRFFEREYAAKVQELKDLSRKKSLPLRLQAYERMVLYMERINPTNSIMNLYKPGMSGKLLQADLIKQIRSEYEHNMAQQVYVGENGWNAVKSAKEETIKLINIASQQVGPDATGIDLSNKIYELMAQIQEAPTDAANRILKREARRLF